MEFFEMLEQFVETENVILDNLKKYDYTLGLALLGAVVDEFFITNKVDVKEGWAQLVEASKFAHEVMND